MKLETRFCMHIEGWEPNQKYATVRVDCTISVQTWDQQNSFKAKRVYFKMVQRAIAVNQFTTAI